jgi:putative transposase
MSSRSAYPTDLSDQEWQTIQAVLPQAKNGRTGRPRTYPLREIWNAIFYILYILRTGGAWRHLPHDFPPYNDVWDHFWCWRNEGVIERVHEALREQVRKKEGKQSTPSAAIIDSQSVKTAQKGALGL